MSDDYLWDRTGEPDPDVKHLENVLGTLRWSMRERTGFCEQMQSRRHTPWRILAAAAAIIVVIIGAVMAVHKRDSAGALTSWQLSFPGEKPTQVRAGQLIETRAGTRGAIQSEFVGRVDIEPDSRLRLVASNGPEQRIALDHGTIHALIWAPPAQFVVETPAAKAVDLGCQYTLQMENSGLGFLTVQTGRVAFEWRGVEVFIPAGAMCRTRPEHGPDTPYFLDASPAFKDAIAEFDVDGSRQALHTALGAARPRDGLTLWHLLQQVSPHERGEVFDRLAGLVRMPADISREGIVRGDTRSLDAAWNALNLGSTSWWREWKRQW